MPFTIKASTLLSRKADIEREHKVLADIEALQCFTGYGQRFAESGLTAGIISFAEFSSRSNRYGLNVSVREPAPLFDEKVTEETFRSAVDVREFADALIAAGAGEFFDVEIDFATFATEYIEPRRAALIQAGVELDI